MSYETVSVTKVCSICRCIDLQGVSIHGWYGFNEFEGDFLCVVP